MMLCAIASLGFSVTPTPEPDTCAAPVPHTAEQLLFKHGVIDELRREKCPNNGNNKNVILVVGDGMGWEMIRAGAIAKKVLAELTDMGIDTTVGATSDAQKASAKAMFAGRKLSDYYTEGKGDGLSFQNLPEYGLMTTSAMVIQEASEGAWYSPSGQSMLEGSTSPSFSAPNVMTRGHDNEMAPLALDAEGKPLVFDPRDYESEGGMMVLWDDVKGGKYPWDENYYKPEGERSLGFDIRFKQRHATDSASTAGAMATGIKTFTGGISCDIYEAPVTTIVEEAMHCGMHGGVVSSVPMLHATPAAFISHSNHRNNGPQLQRTMMETVNPTLAIGNCNGRNYPGGRFGVEHDIDYQARIADGYYGKWTVLRNEIGKPADQALAPMATMDPDDGHKVMGCFPDQASNMPYRGVDSTYSDAVQQNLEAVRDAAGNVIALNHLNEMGHAYTPDELASIPKMKDIVKHSIEFLGKSDKGFFLMYEQGDIDWAAHANHMDDMLGAMLDIDDSVQEIMTWIDNNGGYEKNALYVTADHDHFLTLKSNFPEVVANFLIDGESHKITPLTTLSGGVEGAAKLPAHNKGDETIEDTTGVKTMSELQGWEEGTIDQVGHFWGVEEDGGNAWGSHSSKPVPVSYGGDTGDCLEKLEGKSYWVHGHEVRGSPEKFDQVHLHACMRKALFGLGM